MMRETEVRHPKTKTANSQDGCALLHSRPPSPVSPIMVYAPLLSSPSQDRKSLSSSSLSSSPYYVSSETRPHSFLQRYHRVQVVCCGDTQVGKTLFIRRLFKDYQREYAHNHNIPTTATQLMHRTVEEDEPTVAANVYPFRYSVLTIWDDQSEYKQEMTHSVLESLLQTKRDDDDIEMQETHEIETTLYVYDISGDPAYHKIASPFLKNAEVAFLCYNVADRQSFENLDGWYAKVACGCPLRRVYVIGIQNRGLNETPAVSYNEAHHWAAQHKFFHYVVIIQPSTNSRLTPILRDCCKALFADVERLHNVLHAIQPISKSTKTRNTDRSDHPKHPKPPMNEDADVPLIPDDDVNCCCPS